MKVKDNFRFYNKLDFEIRLTVCDEALDNEEEKQLIKHSSETGWIFEGRTYYEDGHSVEYRFVKYYKK